MSYYDNIFEIASENFGLITTAQARNMGIAKEELGKLQARGKLHRVGRGVYRVKHYAPSSLDIYADAAALVGPEAYVLGESVLAMQNLASVNPEAITVGTPKRVRKQLPCYVKLVQRPCGDTITLYDGIPCMTVADSIRYCEGKVMPDRLEEALVDALAEGLVTKRDVEAIRKELTWHNPSNPIAE
ncbi:MAG: type IV toxin-antitoxin system AbiEi family antitoxin domain-containing protein [Raoultibacter sp.]